MEAERGKDVLDRPQKRYEDKDNPPSPVGWRQAERTLTRKQPKTEQDGELWPGSSQRRNEMENSDPEAASSFQVQGRPNATSSSSTLSPTQGCFCLRYHCGPQCLQCARVGMKLKCCFTSTETVCLLRTYGSPGRLPRLSHSFWAFVGGTVSTWGRWRMPVNKRQKRHQKCRSSTHCSRGTCRSDSRFPQLVV